MPKIEYVPKNFSADRLQMIEKVNGVVAEYQKQGYSLTLRQVYYQMVARDIIPNNMRSYKNLGNLINDARLAGLIDWLAIEDRTRNLRGNSHWSTPGSVSESAAYSYRLDHWQGQQNYVEVWVEKDALIGIVGQICGKLDVAHFSCRGYVSQSEMWAAARRLRRRQEAGQHVILLHLGDHDPSGKDMSRDIQERLITFETYGVTFKRLALNMTTRQKVWPTWWGTSGSTSEVYASSTGRCRSYRTTKRQQARISLQTQRSGRRSIRRMAIRFTTT